MDIEQVIRKLAKSSYYQNLYYLSKDMSGINMFNNISNFSGIQILFLYWVKTYASLYELKNEKEYPFLDQKLIGDPIRVDAFLYFHRKRKEKEMLELKKKNKSSNHKFKRNGKQSTFEVDFGSK